MVRSVVAHTLWVSVSCILDVMAGTVASLERQQPFASLSMLSLVLVPLPAFSHCSVRATIQSIPPGWSGVVTPRLATVPVMTPTMSSFP